MATIHLTGGLQLNIPDERLAADACTAMISIRPEKVHLQKAPYAVSGSENVFSAYVREEIFKGATDQLTITTEAGLTLTVVAANESAHEECFVKGDHVWCRLHPKDIVVVHEAGNLLN